MMKSILITMMACFGWHSLQGKDAPNKSDLTIGLSSQIQQLHPLLIDDAYSEFLFFATSRELTSLDQDWQRRCDLCKRLPSFATKDLAILENPKGFVRIKWQISQKAYWGDGTPVTGSDFEFSWILGKTLGFPAVQKNLFRAIESIEMDPTNPKIFFTTFRYASFRSKILEGFRVIPKHLEEPILRQAQGDIEKYLKTTLYETNPVHPGLYLGPYVITRYEKGLRVELSSNPFYFGQKASIKKINIRPGLSRQSALALIQSGEIGMIAASGLHTDEYLYLQEQLKTTKGTESIKMVVGDSIVLEQISLNLRNPILNDRRIRQALRTSIDPADILNRLNLIVGIPANSFLHPTDPNVISATEIISDRMKQAGHQLEQAGWMKGSDGLRRKNQIPLSLDFDFASDSEVRAFIVKSIKSTWETLGIQVHLKPSPQKHFFDQILPYMHYSGLALFAWTMPVETNSMAMFESQNIPTSSNQQEGTNISAWRNHQVNKLIAEAEAELDNDKRKHLLHQIQTHYFNDSPGIPLYFKHQVAFIPSSIEGYAIPGHQYPETIWIERWEWNPEKHP